MKFFSVSECPAQPAVFGFEVDAEVARARTRRGGNCAGRDRCETSHSCREVRIPDKVLPNGCDPVRSQVQMFGNVGEASADEQPCVGRDPLVQNFPVSDPANSVGATTGADDVQKNETCRPSMRPMIVRTISLPKGCRWFLLPTTMKATSTEYRHRFPERMWWSMRPIDEMIWARRFPMFFLNAFGF